MYDELLYPSPDGNRAWVAGGANGTPCLRCVLACPTGALRPVSIEESRMGYAVINRSFCLAWVSGTCDKCLLICPLAAISEAEPNRPVVDVRKCNGCSQCVAFCPTSPKSVVVKPMGVT